MRRRILFATLTVAALAVVLFALPLAVTVRNLVIADELGELEHLATRAERGVTSASLRGVDPAEFPRSERGTRFGLYDLSGVRRAGKGPQHLEFGLRTVLSGRVAQHRGHRLAVVVPVTGDEHVAAIVRVDAPASETAGRVARAWLLIAACAAAALAIAAILASTQARRIAAPLGRLAQAANRVGAGDRTTSAPRSGVAEIDDIAAALDLAGKRVDDALTRERQFTADASHQLRTPLTALRVALENEVRNANGDRASLETAIAQTDRLEATIDELLALARDTHAVSAPLDLDGLFAGVREQWHGPLAAAGRPLRLAHDTDVEPVRASTIAVRQIIDVLVANAVEHGAGAITLRARRVGDGVAIDVSDEGAGIVGDPAEVFRRRSGDEPGRGIGLALARSLAEAEGGRLVLSRAGAQPVFTLVFASASSSHARSAGSGDAPV